MNVFNSLTRRNEELKPIEGNTIRLQAAEPPYALLALTMLRTGGGSKSELRVSLYAPIPQELLAGQDETVRYELLWRSGQERFIGVEIHEAKSASDTRELSRKEILPQEASPAVLSKLKELTVDAWKEKLVGKPRLGHSDEPLLSERLHDAKRC